MFPYFQRFSSDFTIISSKQSGLDVFIWGPLAQLVEQLTFNQ